MMSQSSSMLRWPSASIISANRCGPSGVVKNPTRSRASVESRKKATPATPLMVKLPRARSQRYSRPHTQAVGVSGGRWGCVSIV